MNYLPSPVSNCISTEYQQSRSTCRFFVTVVSSTHCAHATEGWPGWVGLGGWLHSEMVYQPEGIPLLIGVNQEQLRWSTLALSACSASWWARIIKCNRMIADVIDVVELLPWRCQSMHIGGFIMVLIHLVRQLIWVIKQLIRVCVTQFGDFLHHFAYNSVNFSRYATEIRYCNHKTGSGFRWAAGCPGCHLQSCSLPPSRRLCVIRRLSVCLLAG